eukprot:TRINITY_DN247_c1_g1_i2.p1 TRINITY_DN247_c1_g1~~TRINITY_DN247_c1_g1_i2.p1  ORF type:complete len:410 (+),score=144.06 TRINITY_DN247_c1_g1_i2:736-1965(+)
MITAEEHLPYARPPLSKELWTSSDSNVNENLHFKTREGIEQHIYFEDEESLMKENPNVEWLFNKRVVDIDVRRHLILLDDGQIFEYSKCLIASGCEPSPPPIPIPEDCLDNVSSFKTLNDFKHLEAKSNKIKDIVIFGGEFLGSELACGLAHRRENLKVRQMFPEATMMANIFPQYLSEHVSERIKNEIGVDFHPNAKLERIEKNGEGVVLHLENGERVETDHVVFATEPEPSIDFALKDLEIDPINGGITANAELETRSDLFVAGDVLSYYDMTLKRRRRVEHYDHALNTGETAAANMKGKKMPYSHFPTFWSEMGNVSFEGVGITDSKLETVSVWQKTDSKNLEKGAVYYLDNKKIVGAIVFGAPGKSHLLKSTIGYGLPYLDNQDFKNLISFEKPKESKESLESQD